MSETQNADQIEFWNGEAGEEWARSHDRTEEFLADLGQEVLARANVKAGERVLDIGCGCGATSFMLARAAGADGEVLGVDISAPMLAVATSRKANLPEELQNVVSFQKADASTFGFDKGAYDLLYSRFGVMFFEDVAPAFAHMRKALKPGEGRMVFVCWRAFPENEWMTLPMSVALKHVPPPEKTDPHAPGPFAFADKERVTALLEEAGFADIAFEAYDPQMKYGQSGSLEETAASFVTLGPTGRLLREQTEEIVETVKAGIVEELRPRWRDGGFTLGGACWVVTARNPG